MESSRQWKHTRLLDSSPSSVFLKILRGIVKRKNLKEFTHDEAGKIIDSILVDIDTRIMNGDLFVLPLNDDYLPEVNEVDPFIQFFCH